jgi:hypothetical protein
MTQKAFYKFISKYSGLRVSAYRVFRALGPNGNVENYCSKNSSGELD